MIAGPNGSGKSTLTDQMKAAGYDFGRYVNPDETSKAMREADPSRSQAETDTEAQRRAVEERYALLAQRRSLSYETVFSHESHVGFMQEAKAAGYEVRLIFVGTSGPQVNVDRVALRVADGGHAVPEDKVRSRYARSVANLQEGLRVADYASVLDSAERPPILVAEKTEGRLQIETERRWFEERVRAPMRADGRLTERSDGTDAVSPPLTRAAAKRIQKRPHHNS